MQLGGGKPDDDENHSSTIFTKESAQSLINEYSLGHIQINDLAKKYDLKLLTLSRLIRGVTWKELDRDFKLIKNIGLKHKIHNILFNDNQILQILDNFSMNNIHPKNLAIKYNCSKRAINSIIRGNNNCYSHIAYDRSNFDNIYKNQRKEVNEKLNNKLKERRNNVNRN